MATASASMVAPPGEATQGKKKKGKAVPAAAGGTTLGPAGAVVSPTYSDDEDDETHAKQIDGDPNGPHGEDSDDDEDDENVAGGTAGKGKKKKKKKKGAGAANSAPGQGAQAGQGGGGKSKDIWYKSPTDERHRIREYWLGLTEDERRQLVRLEKESVLKKMKEQGRHTCQCSVCGRKRWARGGSFVGQHSC